MAEISSRFVECIVYKNHSFDNKFLCLKRSDSAKVHPGIWQYVTAKIDAGEKAFETARRETKEETGLEPVNIFVASTINKFYSFENDTIELIPVFIVEVDSTDVKLSEEHSEFEWLSFEDAHARLHWVNQKRMLEEAYEHLKSKELINTLRKIDTNL